MTVASKDAFRFGASLAFEVCEICTSELMRIIQGLRYVKNQSEGIHDIDTMIEHRKYAQSNKANVICMIRVSTRKRTYRR